MICKMSTKIMTTTNQEKKPKVLIVFDVVIAEMISNKMLNSIASELIIRGRKLNTSLAFITQ